MALSFGLGLPPAPKKGGSFYADWPLAFNFVNNKYRVGIGRGYSSSFLEQPGVTYARTGADLLSYNPVTGKWQAFAANAPALLTGAGQDIPEGTTNKCTNYNAAPDAGLTGVTKSGDAAATLTRVDDTAALRAAGFGDLIDAGKMSGLVFKLDNSAGSAVAYANFAGNPGNTNTQTFSVFRRGGTCAINMGSASPTGLPSSAAYRRETLSGVPTNSTTVPYLRADIGQVVYFILNQLEEKTYATNPVIVSGAAATRGNAQPVVTGLSSILTPPFTLVAVANLSAIDGVSRRLAMTTDGTLNNSVLLDRSSGNAAVSQETIGGVLTSGATISGYTGARLMKGAVRVRASEFSQSFDGRAPTTASATAPTTNTLNLGYAPGGSAFLNSPLLFVGIAPDPTDAQLQAITASNGALTDFL